MSAEYLFVYGTLRRGYGHPKHRILEEQGEYRGEASYRGKIHLIGQFPGVIPSDNPGDRVWGDLFLLDDPRAVFSELDPYEGINPDAPSAGLFIRKKQPITKDGKTLNSWIYLYNRPVDDAVEIRSGDFLRHTGKHR